MRPLYYDLDISQLNESKETQLFHEAFLNNNIKDDWIHDMERNQKEDELSFMTFKNQIIQSSKTIQQQQMKRIQQMNQYYTVCIYMKKILNWS